MRWIKNPDETATLVCRKGSNCAMAPAWEIVMHSNGSLWFKCRGCDEEVSDVAAIGIIRKRPYPRLLTDEERGKLVDKIATAEYDVNFGDKDFTIDAIVNGTDGYAFYTDAELIDAAQDISLIDWYESSHDDCEVEQPHLHWRADPEPQFIELTDPRAMPDPPKRTRFACPLCDETEPHVH